MLFRCRLKQGVALSAELAAILQVLNLMRLEKRLQKIVLVQKRPIQRIGKSTAKGGFTAGGQAGDNNGSRARSAHGDQRRKFAIRCNPVFWLFSGWNCVPIIVSRPTMAVTSPP